VSKRVRTKPKGINEGTNRELLDCATNTTNECGAVPIMPHDVGQSQKEKGLAKIAERGNSTKVSGPRGTEKVALSFNVPYQILALISGL
jgi:hypothetical protein